MGKKKKPLLEVWASNHKTASGVMIVLEVML